MPHGGVASAICSPSGGVPAVTAVILAGTTAWNGISRPEKERTARKAARRFKMAGGADSLLSMSLIRLHRFYLHASDSSVMISFAKLRA